MGAEREKKKEYQTHYVKEIVLLKVGGTSTLGMKVLSNHRLSYKMCTGGDNDITNTSQCQYTLS